MSRSVKTPIIKQKNSKLSKKQSNRKVRRCDVNYDGKSYKKLCCCQIKTLTRESIVLYYYKVA